MSSFHLPHRLLNVCQVLELLMDALVHPERVLSRAAEPTARLMAIASVCDGREIMSGTPSGLCAYCFEAFDVVHV